MAKILNSSRRFTEELVLNTIKLFTYKRPHKVETNKRSQYVACWSGNFMMWISMSFRKDNLGSQYSITLGRTLKEAVSTHCYFYCNDPTVHIRDIIDFFIQQYNFQF